MRCSSTNYYLLNYNSCRSPTQLEVQPSQLRLYGLQLLQNTWVAAFELWSNMCGRRAGVVVVCGWVNMCGVLWLRYLLCVSEGAPAREEAQPATRKRQRIRYSDLPRELDGVRVGWHFWMFHLLAREVLRGNRGLAFAIAVQGHIGPTERLSWPSLDSPGPGPSQSQSQSSQQSQSPPSSQ